jgi:hypothetical protein
MAAVFGSLIADLNHAFIHDLGVVLCLLTFLTVFVLWFMYYVRVENPEEARDEDGQNV